MCLLWCWWVLTSIISIHSGVGVGRELRRSEALLKTVAGAALQSYQHISTSKK